MDHRGDASGRDPTHISEEAVEENGDEYIPHFEYYEGADEYPIKTPPEHTAALILAPPTKYHTMAVIPGLCVRSLIDSTSFVLSIALIILQFGVLDFYFFKQLENTVWTIACIALDSVVISVLCVLAVLAIRYNRQQMEEVCSIDGRLKYAYIAWLIYAFDLVLKIIACFLLFYKELPGTPSENNDKLFDDLLFKLALSLSVLIFVFLFEAHHYTPLMSSRQIFISYILVAVCLDLIDNIYFLDIIWQALKENWMLNYWIELAVLVVASINFLMPTFSLLKLRFARPRVFLVSDKIWALIYVLIVNGPVLGLRIYLYVLLEVDQRGRRYDPSLFAVKNVAAIYLAVRELWTRLQYWRMKRRAIGSRGELTAPPPIDDDN